MNLKQQRAELAKKAAAFNARLKAGETLTAEETAAVKELLAKIDELDTLIKEAEEQANLLDRIGAISTEEEPAEPSGDVEAKSLGDHFVKSLRKSGATMLVKDRPFSAPEFKANTDVHKVGGDYGPLVTEVDKEAVFPAKRPLTIAKLMANGPITGNSVTYPVYPAVEGNAGTVEEGGKKPQLNFGKPEWKTEALKEVAGWIDMSEDMLEDLAYIASQIDGELVDQLLISEEDQLINGDGSGSNVRGILNRDGIQSITATNDDFADKLAEAKTKVKTATGSRYSADAIVMHPDDYLALLLKKDGNNQYYGGGFFQNAYGNGSYAGEPAVWLLPTITTTAVPKGTALVGAFRSAKILRKGGVKVASTNSHGENFTSDLVTIRAKERLLLEVKWPAAFVKVTVS